MILEREKRKMFRVSLGSGQVNLASKGLVDFQRGQSLLVAHLVALLADQLESVRPPALSVVKHDDLEVHVGLLREALHSGRVLHDLNAEGLLLLFQLFALQHKRVRIHRHVVFADLPLH